MAHRPTKDAAGKPPPKGREDRLKAALKANMARRKAQARARTDAKSAGPDGQAQEKAEKSALDE